MRINNIKIEKLYINNNANSIFMLLLYAIVNRFVIHCCDPVLVSYKMANLQFIYAWLSFLIKLTAHNFATFFSRT